MKKIFLIAISIFIVSNISFSQVGGKFTFAGGPTIGYYSSSVTDLNAELVKAGFPEISTKGFLTLGGSGYIDIPMVQGLRIGGYGFGFSESQSSQDNYSKYSVKYSYSSGGITIEYTKMLGEKFDFTIGGAIGIGNLNIDLYQHSTPNTILNSSISIWDTIYNSKHLNYSSQTYTFEPRIGLGFQVNNFLNFKLNAGYAFAVQNNWKLDDVLQVENIPSGIKAQGLNIGLCMNIGLFLK